MLKRPLTLVALVAVVVSVLAGCGRADTIRRAGDDCVSARSLPDGDTVRTIESGGQRRSYLLHVPPGYDGSTRTPLVMLFHGFGGDPEAVVETTRMDELADQDETLLVAPIGRGRMPGWDFSSPITDPRSDLAFVRDLVDEVKADACVDPRRVYASGFSNGSVLTLALACDGTTRFAAYAGVSGPYWADSCAQTPPVSLIYFHGLRDKVVPYEGASTVIGPLPPVRDVMTRWAAHNSCPPVSATTTVSENVRNFAWTGCRAGSAVDVYVVQNGGHRWPGGATGSRGEVSGITTQEIDASRLIWKFLTKHPAGGH